MKTLILLSIVSFYTLIAQDSTYLTAIIPDFQVNEKDELITCGEPSIIVDCDGNFTIIWTEEQNDKLDIYAQRYSNNGTALGNNFKINDTEFNIEFEAYLLSPAISSDQNGNFIITWVDYSNYNLYAKRYSSVGAVLGSKFKVNEDDGGIMSSPDIVSDKEGNFIIAWVDGYAGADIYAQRYSSNGSLMGTNLRVDDNEGSSEGAFNQEGHIAIRADSSGNFVISWEDTSYSGQGWSSTNIYAQRYSSEGIASGTNFKVNKEEGTSRAPDIALSKDGNFVITWSEFVGDWGNSEYIINGQRFSRDGIAQGNNFQINDSLLKFRLRSTISSDEFSNYIVTWANYDPNENLSNIFTQRYSKNGLRVGNNFIVTNATYSNPFSPDVRLWNGRIYTTWADNRAGGTGYDIWANVLDGDFPTDIKNDTGLKLPTKILLSQNYPNPFNPSTIIKYQIPQNEKR